MSEERDSRIEDHEDNDLQSLLYARIYYESNIEDESQSKDIPRTMRLKTATGESTFEMEKQRRSVDDQPVESAVVKESVHEDATIELIEAPQIDKDGAFDEEMNPTLHQPENVNKTPEHPSTIREKGTSNSARKHKCSNKTKHGSQDDLQEDDTSTRNTVTYSKYNVLQKHEKLEMKKKLNAKDLENSDSEDSIFEVPVPPKPKPLLINLQDSEDEIDKHDALSDDGNNKDASKDVSRHAETASVTISNVDTTKESNSSNDTSSKNKNNGKSPRNKNPSRNLTSAHVQQPGEDIILNCTTVQKGARNISEIRQLSRNAEKQKNKSESTVEKSPKSRKKSQHSPISAPQSISGRNHENNAENEISLSQNLNQSQLNIFITNTKYNTNPADQDSFDNNVTVTVSCDTDKSNAAERKRQHDDKNESNPVTKRRCIQQDNENVTSQCSSGEKRNDSSSEHSFNRMPERLRNHYYNSTRSQENLSVAEIQSGMSKDPQMWAILDEDMQICSNRRVRFYNVKCMNCQQEGHRRGDCPMPRKIPCCHMCGTQGHTEFRCPKKMCLTCGKKQNVYRKTCEYCRDLYCTMCHSIGHKTEQCPDLWRRYHQTTSMDDVPPQDPGNVMKPPHLLHCCNCTKRGHESSECTEYRWSQHYRMPAAVTNYTDGPVYAWSATNSPESETSIPRPEITSDKLPVLQLSRSIPVAQQVTTDRRADTFATNNEALSTSSAINAPTQEAAYSQKVRDHPNPLPITNKYSSSKHNQKKKKEFNDLTETDFVDIVYECGTIIHKNKKDIMALWRNLSTINTIEDYFDNDMKNTVINNLKKRTLVPIFFEKLYGKVEFQIKIGFISQHQQLMILVVARRDCVNYIYELLVHWIRIPDDEKAYGIDVTLPINTIKMYNLLSSRKPQLVKMRFTSFDKHSNNDENDPRSIFRNINKEKQIMSLQTAREYFRSRAKLWRLQIKLLILANTESKCDNCVSNFFFELKYLEEIVKQNQFTDTLTASTYLKFTLLYNRLFVPHTSHHVIKMLNRMQKNNKAKKKSNCPPQPDKQKLSHEQNNLALCTSDYGSSFPASYTEERDSPESPPLSEQGINYNNPSIEIIERNNEMNDIPPGTSDMTNASTKCDRLFIIDNIGVQNNQTIEPISLQSGCIEKDEVRSLRSDINYGINITINGENTQNINMKQLQKPNNSMKNKDKVNKNTNILSEKLHRKAMRFIKEAYAFKLPHLTNAADILQRLINDNVATKKHVNTLLQLLILERKHQKHVNTLSIVLK